MQSRTWFVLGLPLLLAICTSQAYAVKLPFNRPQTAPSADASSGDATTVPATVPSATIAPRPTTRQSSVSSPPPPAPSSATVIKAPELEDLKPMGYAPGGLHVTSGNSGAKPGPVRASNVESDFLPISDRWRIGLPAGYSQNVHGSMLDPYNQNVLKGDYPAFGSQDVFLNLSLTSDTLLESRRTPVPSNVSTAFPGKFTFFGQGRSEFVRENVIMSGEIFQGDASYQPKNWSFRATAVANVNFVQDGENGEVNPDVRYGRNRSDGHLGMQELFAEFKLSDVSPHFDFVSVRAGIQGFTSDFRGFLYSDDEPGVRLFGNSDNNRNQYNLAWFYQLEKDTNSGLNTFNGRDQNVFIANLYRQDFFFPGYTAQFSFHANIDQGKGFQYDRNGFLVRPSPVGTIGTKDVYAYYLGWAGDGHIGRINISHQFYQALGYETFNQIAGRGVTIDAQMAAVELSYDADFARYRTSFIYLSGDSNPKDHQATGFDTIMDNPNFAGGAFSYFTREEIPLVGTALSLVGPNSFTPDLRTSKDEGQANFVNPGLLLYNIGADFNITPKLTLITNASYLQFANTSSIQYLLQDGRIRRDIGVDLSIGLEYRPFLNNNVIMTFGEAALIPGTGFKDIYTSETLYSTFFALTMTY